MEKNIDDENNNEVTFYAENLFKEDALDSERIQEIIALFNGTANQTIKVIKGIKKSKSKADLKKLTVAIKQGKDLIDLCNQWVEGLNRDMKDG